MLSVAAWGQKPSDNRIGKKAQDGGLSESVLSEIRKGWAGTPSDKALRNALAGTSIATLSAN